MAENVDGFLNRFLIFLFLASTFLVAQPHQKCGFAAFAERRANMSSEELAAFQRQRLAKRQTLTEVYPSPSGHFLIHYDPANIPTYDRNSDGTPDYLEFVANSFDRAWEVEIDSLGFRVPPDEDGNPVTVYNVDCFFKQNGLYGETIFGVIPVPGDPPEFFRFASTIEMNTNYQWVDYPWVTDDPIVRDSLAIAVTAAHEFHHAIQLGYRLWTSDNTPEGPVEDLWLFESTATYMEEVVATQVNDYFYYLDCILGSSDLNPTVDNGCGRIYGKAIFFIMLGEHYGTKGITREIWEAVRSERGVASVETVLSNRGSSYFQELQRLAHWLAFTGPDAVDEEFFPDAASFYTDTPPNGMFVEPGTVSFDTGPDQEVYEGTIAPLSFQLFKVPVVSSQDVLISITVEENEEFWDGAQILPASTENIAINQPSVLTFNRPNDEIIFAVTGGNWNEGNPRDRRTFKITFNSQGQLSDVFPNPVRPGSSQVTFANLTDATSVEVFSSNGQHLATILLNEGQRIASWNLETKHGEMVGSGVYLYHIVSETAVRTGKVMVIR